MGWKKTIRSFSSSSSPMQFLRKFSFLDEISARSRRLSFSSTLKCNLMSSTFPPSDWDRYRGQREWDSCCLLPSFSSPFCYLFAPSSSVSTCQFESFHSCHIGRRDSTIQSQSPAQCSCYQPRHLSERSIQSWLLLWHLWGSLWDLHGWASFTSKPLMRARLLELFQLWTEPSRGCSALIACRVHICAHHSHSSTSNAAPLQGSHLSSFGFQDKDRFESSYFPMREAGSLSLCSYHSKKHNSGDN